MLCPAAVKGGRPFRSMPGTPPVCKMGVVLELGFLSKEGGEAVAMYGAVPFTAPDGMRQHKPRLDSEALSALRVAFLILAWFMSTTHHQPLHRHG